MRSRYISPTAVISSGTSDSVRRTVDGGDAGRHFRTWRFRRNWGRPHRWNQNLISSRHYDLLGSVTADRIELQKSLPEAVVAMFGVPPPSDNKPRPAIGPPPDRSDPSMAWEHLPVTCRLRLFFGG